jgi:hypothetical protein
MDLLRGLQKQLADLERRAVPRGIRAAEGYRNAGSPVASARPLMNPVVATGLSSVGMTANLLSKGAIIPSLIEKTKEVFNPRDNIITSLRNFGTSVENQFAAPGQERRYVGSSPTAVAANRRLDASRSLNAIDTVKYGPTDWNPSANPLSAPSAPVLPPPTQGAADRAYQRELSRTAQLTVQDPELQRYEKARAGAKSQEEMNAVRDMGLAMWQNKYGGSPMGQPGGAIGSRNPLMDSPFGYQTGMSPGDVAKTITNPSVVPVSPGEAPYQMGDLGTRATSETGYDPAAYGLSPELIKAYQEQLLKQAGSK